MFEDIQYGPSSLIGLFATPRLGDLGGLDFHFSLAREHMVSIGGDEHQSGLE